MGRKLLFVLVLAWTGTAMAEEASEPAPQPAAAADANESGHRPAEKGTFGVGLILGEPTGICAKLYLQDDQAIQAAAGSAFIGGGLQLHADYVFHPWILQDARLVRAARLLRARRALHPVRRRARRDSHFAIGLRGVVGLLFDFKEVPLDVFVEVAGVLEYDFKDGEGVGLALNAGAGVRYYF